MFQLTFTDMEKVLLLKKMCTVWTSLLFGSLKCCSFKTYKYYCRGQYMLLLEIVMETEGYMPLESL